MKTQNKWEKLFDEFMDLIEFDLIKHKRNYNQFSDDYGIWSIVDKQGGNIGNIENDRFNSAIQFFDRIDSYIQDYIVDPILNEIDTKNIDDIDRVVEYCDWEDLLEYKEFLPESIWDFNILNMICNHATDIDFENCTYEEEIDMNTIIKSLQDKITQERNLFKEHYLKKSSLETYNDFYKIAFFEEYFAMLLGLNLVDYFEDEEILWLNNFNKPLEFLYGKWLSSDGAFNHDWDIMIDFIHTIYDENQLNN